jgi:hypothetical protein
MKFLCRRELGSLRPIDEAAEDEFRKLKLGATVMVEVKRLRNPKHHQLYWALVSKVFDNQSRYETREKLHDALKLACGVYDLLEMPDGKVHKIPGSIAFERMDQTQFGDFYNRVCDVIAAHFLPGVTSEELKAEVSEMIGVQAA